MTNEPKNSRLDLWCRTLRGVGGVALIFSLVVGVLLTTDWLHAGQAKTVRLGELSQVEALARQSPGDANVVALAREMDRVARHAYFSSVTFRNAGVWMLAIGLVLAVGCLHLAARMGRRIADPRTFPALDQVRADREARMSLLVAGVGSLLLLTLWAIGHVPDANSMREPTHLRAPGPVPLQGKDKP